MLFFKIEDTIFCNFGPGSGQSASITGGHSVDGRVSSSAGKEMPGDWEEAQVRSMRPLAIAGDIVSAVVVLSATLIMTR